MELLDVYTARHERTGRTIPRGSMVSDGEHLLAVHVCVLNSRNEMLIQHRHPGKDRYPGCWDLSAGGFARAGETSLAAVRRELEEELGLDFPEEAFTFLFTEPFSYLLDDFFLLRFDADAESFRLQEEEVTEVKWASLQEVEAMISDGSFVDYPMEGIRRVFRMAEKART